MKSLANMLLGTQLHLTNKDSSLKMVKENLRNSQDFFHIVSLNPEIMMIAQQDNGFRAILQSANLQLVDGIGVYLALKMKGYSGFERSTGADFMNEILAEIKDQSFRIMLIGGADGIAEELADCYAKKFQNLSFLGTKGIKDINTYHKETEGAVITRKIADWKPHIVFVSFGSPFQETWIWDNRDTLQGVVCMGVGGGFDYALGKVPRAPKFIRKIGLEWLFRLSIQPWRWRRQLRLIQFTWHVMLNK